MCFFTHKVDAPNLCYIGRCSLLLGLVVIISIIEYANKTTHIKLYYVKITFRSLDLETYFYQTSELCLGSKHSQVYQKENLVY